MDLLTRPCHTGSARLHPSGDNAFKTGSTIDISIWEDVKFGLDNSGGSRGLSSWDTRYKPAPDWSSIVVVLYGLVRNVRPNRRGALHNLVTYV